MNLRIDGLIEGTVHHLQPMALRLGFFAIS